jgi:hypothetical protein
MIRFHVELTDDRGSFASDAIAMTAGGTLVSTVGRYNGRSDLALIDVTEDHAEYLRELLEDDDNVLSYRESNP